MKNWQVYKGTGEQGKLENLPPPPPWRDFSRSTVDRRGRTYLPSDEEIDMVNAALYLRRPLLVTGDPGSGKSSLAYAVAYELGLGEVLRWPISSRSTLQEGLYQYDAISRLRDVSLRKEGIPTGEVGDTDDIGRYISLGPLGTALLPTSTPRVLLVDEIDKSDIDLPNDLLHVFEDGWYPIPELERVAKVSPDVIVRCYGTGATGSEMARIHEGRVQCEMFPLVIMTSNGERELPDAFHRRCLRLQLPNVNKDRLRRIVAQHLGAEAATTIEYLLDDFLKRNQEELLARDQLLNIGHLIAHGHLPEDAKRRASLQAGLLRQLGSR